MKTKPKKARHTTSRSGEKKTVSENSTSSETRKNNSISSLNYGKQARKLLDSTLDGFILADVKGNIADVNPSYCKLTGYSKKELLEMNISSLEAKLSKVEIGQTINTVLKDGKGKFETVHRSKAGDNIDIEVSLTVLKNEGTNWIAAFVRDISSKNKAYETLKYNENLLSKTQEIAAIGSYVFDIQRNCWESSSVLDNIFGIDEKYERNVEGWIHLVHQPDREMMQQHLADHVLSKKKPFDKEYRISRVNDKAVRWVHGMGELELDKNGIPVKLFGTIQDITNRITIQQELVESEVKYRSLFDQSADATLIIEGDKFVDCNPAAVKILKANSRAEVINTHPSELSPEYQADGRKSFEKANEMMAIAYEKGSTRFEWLHKRMNGEVFPAEVLLTTIPIGNRKFIHVVWRDITNRKKAEEELEESNNRFRSLFDDSPVPLWEEDFSELMDFLNGFKNKGITDFRKWFDTNPDQLVKCAGMIQIKNVNQAALVLHQADNKEQLLGNLGKIFTESSYHVFKEEIIALAEGKNEFEAEGEVLTLNGEKRYIKLKISIGRKSPDINRAILATVDITKRTLAEKALRISEDRFRSIVEHSFEGIGLINDKFCFTYANNNLLKMFGYSREEVINTDFRKYLSAENYRMVVSRYKRRQKGESVPEKYEVKILQKNKTEIITELSSTVLYDMDGKPQTVVHLIDITQKKKAGDAIKESEKKYRELFENSNDAIFLHDLDGKIIDVNQKTVSLLGYSHERLTSMLVNELHPTDSVKESKKAFRQIIDKGFVNFEINFLKKNGRIFAAEVSSNIIEIGGVKLVQGMVRDVTARKEAELKLKLSERRFRLLFEALGDAVFVTRLEGKNKGNILEVNPAALSQTGYTRNELLKMNIINDLRIEDINSEAVENLEKQLKTGKPIRFTERKKKKDGTYFWTEVTVTPFVFEGVAATLSINHDITSRKRAEDALAESELKYRSLIEHSKDAIFLYYLNHFEILNDQFIQMFGYSISDLNNKNFELQRFIAPKNRKALEERLLIFLQEDTPPQNFEFTALSKAGREIEVEASVTRVKYKDSFAIQGIIRDVTEKKKQQKLLMNAIFDVQENEKFKFGKDLHDGLGQLLTSTSMYLESIRQAESSLDKSKINDLTRARQLNKQAIVEARRMSHGMMITGIEDKGLKYLLRELSVNTSVPGLTVSFDHRNINEDIINSEVKTHIYRIVQELLTNIIKHSNATKARISMSRLKNNSLKLVVADNGKGFSIKRTNPGAGLKNIRQRASVIKGELEIKSGPQGSEIIILVPLSF